MGIHTARKGVRKFSQFGPDAATYYASANAEGREAFSSDNTLLDNPYWPAEGDQLLEVGVMGWDDGWCEAFRESIADPVM